MKDAEGFFQNDSILGPGETRTLIAQADVDGIEAARFAFLEISADLGLFASTRIEMPEAELRPVGAVPS
ncbi:hypothetical protein [Rhizocola hellebori]|uniref:hypothetical protein n=1 Tax=Rhizocola hellebori TaxID=1392758 RepID=UPI001942584F|nr:hypothetical protein [Rhizocola hellebori]